MKGTEKKRRVGLKRENFHSGKTGRKKKDWGGKTSKRGPGSKSIVEDSNEKKNGARKDSCILSGCRGAGLCLKGRGQKGGRWEGVERGEPNFLFWEDWGRSCHEEQGGQMGGKGSRNPS